MTISARAAVLAMGGAHHTLGADAGTHDTLAFQPLLRIDDSTERSWAAEWIAALLAAERVPVTPEVKDAVWSALDSLASAPPAERTMTGLALLLQSNALRRVIQPYTLTVRTAGCSIPAKAGCNSPTSSISRRRRCWDRRAWSHPS